MTLHNHGSGGEPARPEQRGGNFPPLSPEREARDTAALRSIQERMRENKRLALLAEPKSSDGVSRQVGDTRTLPLSGLSQVAPGVLLFKGGARG